MEFDGGCWVEMGPSGYFNFIYVFIILYDAVLSMKGEGLIIGLSQPAGSNNFAMADKTSRLVFFLH